MLTELSIRDFALIDEAELHFGSGLNAITGETGAGKSLLIGSLELLLGERPRGGPAAWVRQGAERARVEGRFLLPRGPVASRVAAFLAEELPAAFEDWQAAWRDHGGWPPRGGAADAAAAAAEGEAAGPAEVELILGRTLELSGRSRAHINHTPVTAKALRGLALLLIELHGQNAHQRLLEPAHQLELLDAFASSGRESAGRELLEYGRARQRWRVLGAQLAELEASRRQRADRADLLRFQVAELAELAPRAGEFEALRTERERLRHAGDLASDLAQWIQGLSEAEGSALDRLRGLERSAMVWAGRLRQLEGVASELLEARLRCEEALSRIVSFADGLEIDPERLELVEARLEVFERLSAKHGLPPEELPGLAQELERELADLDDQGGDAERLGAELAQALAELEQAAARLTRQRRQAAGRLGQALAPVLPALGLPHARLEVQLSDRAARTLGGESNPGTRFAADGADEVEFLFAANPGEELRPLRLVASGGETARLVLALRSVLAGADAGRTLIFDEIDTGVGGRLAPELARHLRGLGTHHQVLTVTHLPPIAAASHRHLKVVKAVVGGRTQTRFEDLVGEARVAEIADMLSGGARQATARAEAKRLLTGAA